MVSAKGNDAAAKKKAPKTAKSSPSHPPYIEMAKEAIVALKERAGSSHYAIAKYIEEKQGRGRLPPNFKKLLFLQLKRFVASGKLVKVKNSFKVPSATAASKPAPAGAATAKKVLKRKAGATVKARPAKARKTAVGPAKVKKAAAPSKVKKVPGKVAAKKPKSFKSPGKRVSRP